MILIQNKYIKIIRINSQVHNVVNIRSGIAIGAISIKPQEDEVCLLTGNATKWNITCLEDTLTFIKKTYPRFSLKNKLTFTKKMRDKKRKTDIYQVTDIFLRSSGIIKYYAQWRQYCLISTDKIYFMDELSQIIEMLQSLKDERTKSLKN